MLFVATFFVDLFVARFLTDRAGFFVAFFAAVLRDRDLPALLLPEVFLALFDFFDAFLIAIKVSPFLWFLSP